MTDIQLLTLALAVIVPLSLLLYSNSRITEAKETLRAETRELRTEVLSAIRDLRAEMKTMHAELLSEIRDTRHLLKLHELEHHSK